MVKYGARALIWVFLVGLPVFAQTAQTDQKGQPVKTQNESVSADEKERAKDQEKKALALVEEVLKEAQGLRLAENRIRLQVTAADLLWKHDQKKARGLLKAAVDGLAEVQRQNEQAALSASGTGGARFSGLDLIGSQYLEISNAQQSYAQLRQEILTVVARLDAKLLRGFLAATTPSRSGSGGSEWSYVDRQLEISLATQLVDSDPAEAVKVAEQILDREFPGELTSVVGQLLQKEKDEGNKLAGIMISKLRSQNLSRNESAAGFASMLLHVLLGRSPVPGVKTEQSAPAADERLIRELMEIAVGAALNPPDPRSKPSEDDESEDEDDEEEDGTSFGSLLGMLRTILPDVQRYAPSRYAALKAKIDEEDSKLSAKDRAQIEAINNARSEYGAYTSGSVDGLLSAAEKAQGENREQLYTMSAMRMAANGDVEGATRIVEERVTDPAKRKMLMNMINAQSVSQAAEQGKLDQARRLLDGMAPGERAAALLHFASSAAEKGDKKQAILLLEEARSLLPGSPGDAIELLAQMGIAALYSSLGSPVGFEMMERSIDQINGLIAALAVIDGFEPGRRFRDGELNGEGQSLIVNTAFLCANGMAALSRSDLDRARTCADRFERQELRLIARMSIARGILSATPIRPVDFFRPGR